MERADGGDKPNWPRTAVVLCCLLVVGAAALVMPAFGTDGVEGSPIDQILPGESAGQTSADSRFGSGQSGLGALSPGDSTGVGGDVELDGETFGSTDTELHFTVESSTSTYWRTGAYDQYTGSGWERTGGVESIDSSIPHEGNDGERIDWKIEFEKPATAVPTAWRPKVLDGVDDLRMTDQRSIQSKTPIEAGETIEGVSYAPQQDAGTLRAAGDNYPAEIAERYTQLPSETPPRLGRFTSDLTDDAETPYEKAVAIENWLEEAKEYDLTVSERSDRIASRFIFQMEAGYCEYFATAMVTMLRSQDIPARYVVGYSSGQSVGDNTYEVRAMNAHAWVEVYFEDVGWVRFDPTPADERLATQEQALEADGQEFDPGAIQPPEDRDLELPDTDSSGFETTLNQTALPGEPVEVTVTYDGFPVNHKTVYFNSEPVGKTGSDGKVVGVVPDADELRVSIVEGSRSPTAEVIDPSPQTDQHVQASGGFSPSTVGEKQDDERTDTHPIERTASISVSGEHTPGETVTVTAAVGDLLLDGATVTVDGARVGETDDRGQIDFELPDEPGTVTVRAERGLVSGERTIEVSTLTLTTERNRLPAMALGSVTVEAELGNEPAVGVPVEVDGQQVATTGTDGTATVQLPFDSETTLSVSAGGQRQQVVLSGLLWRFGVAILLVLSTITAPVYSLRARGYSPRESVMIVLTLPGKLAAKGRAALISLVLHGGSDLASTKEWMQGAIGGLIAILRGEKPVGETLSALRARHSGVWNRITSSLARFRPGRQPGASDQRAQLTVQEAWSQFLDNLSVRTVETRTPGELASYAVEEDDLPEEPVLALRDTFREVEYGSRPPTDRLERVEKAIEQIERATHSAGEESDN